MSGPLAASLIAAVAVVLIALAIVSAIFLRRQWARSEESRLRLTAKITGLADEREVI